MAVFYEGVSLPEHICNFKKNETKKFRDAVCEFWGLQLIQTAKDGNCFFEAVSTAMAHFEVPLDIPAKELRFRIGEWLGDCKVRYPHTPPSLYTTLHHLVIERIAWRCWCGMPQIHA